MATTMPDAVQLPNSALSRRSREPVCCCGWGDKCVEIQQVLQEGGLLAGFARMRQPNSDSSGLAAEKKRMFIAHTSRHCGATVKAKGRISVAKHHWRPSVHAFLKEEKNKRKDISSHLFHFPTLSAWKNVNKAEPLNRCTTPDQRDALHSATNQDRSLSSASGKKRKAKGFSAFLTPDFTENGCDAHIEPL